MCCLLFVVCGLLLFDVRCALFVGVGCLSFVVRCLSRFVRVFFVYCLMCVVSVVYYLSLFVGCCSLCVVGCLVLIVVSCCCLWFVACCQLFVAC